MTHHEIKSAMDQLRRSERGRRSLSSFMQWLDDNAIGLDAMNQQAMRTLLDAAFSHYSLLRRTFEQPH